MKQLFFTILIFFFLQSCTPAKYVWLQRKIQLTDRGYKPEPNASWQPLDTAGAKPIYEVKRLRVKAIYPYGN